MSENIKEVFTDCTLCYHSCGIKVTVDNGKATKVEGLQSHPLNMGKLCPKGEAMLESIYSPNRIKHPMKRINGGWEQITWDQALTEIADKLNQLKADFGPEIFGIFCGSIGVENLEMGGLCQRFRAAVGSPNYFSVESVCYRMRIRTRQITFGKYPTEGLDSNLYILWGHNPDESDFPLKLALEEHLGRGAKLVVIDPKRIPIADRADMYLRIRPGTDGAMALAMINVIINENLYDKEFVEKYTHGFNELIPHIQQYTPEWAQEITWVSAEDIRKLARLFAATKGASIYQGTCTQDQTASGTQTSRAFSVLQVITGNINIPGGWVISPRLRFGNVGAGTKSPPLGADKYPIFYEVFGRKSPYGVVTMLPESIPEKIKSFMVIGGNPILSMAGSNAFKEAFKKLDLLVVHDLFMTETAELADYVLPACSCLEKWGVAYTYNVCHCVPYLMLRKKAIEPLHEGWSEWKFFTQLSKKMGLDEYFPWKSEEELVAFELEPSGLTFDELLTEKPEGAYYQEKTYEIMGDSFPTPTGKIEIFSDALEHVGHDPLPTYSEPEKSPQGSRWKELGEKYPLILSTGNRNLYYTHSQHRGVKTLRAGNPEPRAELGQKTAEKYNVKEGDSAIIETDCGQVKMKVKVSERVSEGVVLVPHGWAGDANANLLTDTICREEVMGYPQLKSLLCSIRKI
ncbi:MAG TPA: molybdopterin-dependent oxidoreductase [Desulfobacteraceae bacterium]|nr:molybdopterin-dependent oxidoreductase [Desulfobacteraceae bacterium]HPQ29365.1 molybdopterin-dependent oxidoreductase [Desulfobacteraceae bacterium]